MYYWRFVYFTAGHIIRFAHRVKLFGSFDLVLHFSYFPSKRVCGHTAILYFHSSIYLSSYYIIGYILSVGRLSVIIDEKISRFSKVRESLLRDFEIWNPTFIVILDFIRIQIPIFNFTIFYSFTHFLHHNYYYHFANNIKRVKLFKRFHTI